MSKTSNLSPRFFKIFYFCAVLLAGFPLFAQSTDDTAYWAVRFPANHPTNAPAINRYGVPFIPDTLPIQHNRSTRVKIGGKAKRIFLLGMTDTAKPHSWTNLHEGYGRRYFFGDEMGTIRLNYMDGSSQTFPLVFGENLWWGEIFYTNPEPYFSDADFRKALQKSLRLYPAAPVKDGNYVAVINPGDQEIADIVVKDSPVKNGVPIISGITVESAAGEKIANGNRLPGGPLSPDFAKFAEEKPMCPAGTDVGKIQDALEDFKRAFYQNDWEFKGHVATEIPAGYSGPGISFKGDIYADILANAFYANVQDMRNKIAADGMYHTSTKGAANWSRYTGFGTYQTNVGLYYNESWSRDMGRSLQELSELDYTNEALRCADYCIRCARLWEEPSNEFNGRFYPPHWGRIANKPQPWCIYENDGHGLTSMFLYRLWLRLPNRDEWLRARWPDVKAAGDWVLWQLDHPTISGSTNGVLFTTSEAAAMVGYSVYCDYSCMNALEALANMANSIGETNSVVQWRARAAQMRAAMAHQYVVHDPEYGRVWTLRYAGWPNKSTVLGPLDLLADYEGFAPGDDDPAWRPINEAAYQRLVDTYEPFGFYGLAMGYGQGLVTQGALLLDRMNDATTMLNWAAKIIYNPHFDSFIAPEAADVDPTGHYWYRMSDLGNGVQEAEIVKMLRLVIGVDDTQPDRLRFYPRMPYDWNEIAVSKYPVLFEKSGISETTFLQYKLKRVGNGMKLEISADQAIGPVAIRLGPFKKKPDTSKIRINGEKAPGAHVERSGDSWWVGFTSSIVQ
ncbi:MAG TPA: hypothetical protein VH280_02780 [Verrucomicrobiae bacterium]|jgi:hypothetical protein|nr:hypothetical protein [Verrucomicrobiae bacterium]